MTSHRPLQWVAGIAAALSIWALPAQAVPVELIQIGTFSTNPGSGNINAGFNLGNKFVIRTTYDAALTPATTRSIGGLDFRVIDLNAGGNSFDLFVPMEGQGTVYAQNQGDHLPFFNPTPQIIFTAANAGSHNLPPVTDAGLSNPAAPDFVGYEFEGDFTGSNPAGPTNGNFAELFVEVANVDMGGGVIQRIATFNTDMAHCSDASCADFTIAIRSNQRQPDQPAIALAQGIIAEAGPNITFSAGALDQTTDASSQNNNLGNARADKEDFVSYDWTVADSTTGTLDGTTLVGSNVDGAQDDIIPVIGNPTVIDPPGPYPQRAVENVNRLVGLENSGLTRTTDTATWQVVVTEDISGLGGDAAATDTVTVSYSNAAPTAEAGGDIVFNAANHAGPVATSGAGVSDADLVANARIADFEQLSADFQIGGASLPGDPVTISGSTVAHPLSRSIGLLQAGLSTTVDTATLDLLVSDLAGASDADSATIRYDNALPSIANASATATGVDNADLQFDLAFDDADLIVNGLITDFEQLVVEILVDSFDQTGLFGALIGTGSQTLGNAALIAQFGLGAHSFLVSVTDRAGATATADFLFNVIDRQAPVPAPGTLLLLGIGIAALAARRRSPAAPHIGGA